jgi:DNA-directed RNA polymerase specialized sigma24 family protein
VETLEFGHLYEHYARDVLRFALYLTGSRAEAEDITSETFVRAWVESDTIRVGTVKAYLFIYLSVEPWPRIPGRSMTTAP